MDGKKVYQIEINGIKESIAAVESLNKQLDTLEQRMNSINATKVSTGGGGSTSSRNNISALTEEERLQKEINKLKQEGAQLDAKIAASQDEIYKRVDATKQLYKATIADQKALAAQERLTADAYSNTMVGMKQQLADIKAVIQTTDLGDGDKIKKMTEQANQLTNKLKEMEEAYGQFGRNVGNYKSAADGFKGLAIQVGDVTKEFDNAKQALKELKKERDTLSTKKDMGLISEEEAKRLEDLIPVVAQLQSSIQDAGKPMDALMDSMQSVVAIAQTGKGIAAFFGVDGEEIERSIQKLVALQNAMQGLQTIQKQLQERQGVGAWIAPFITQIDKATAKLLTFNTALLGTSKAAKVAAVGIKTLGKALKGLATLGIMVLIEVAIEKVMDLVESFNKLSEVEKVQKDVEGAMADAYGKGMAKLTQYKTRLDSFNGSKMEEKKLVEELNKEFGDTLGTYKTIAEWQDVLDKKGKAYIETLKLQAKAQAALNAVTAAYAELMRVQMGIANGEYDGFWNSIFGKSGEARLAEAEAMVKNTSKLLEDVTKEQEEFNKKNKLGDYAPQIKKNARNTKNALEEAQKTLNSLEIRLMREGLNKKLRQLDEEERQTINKLKENGRKSGVEIQKVQRAYNQLRAKEIQDYLLKLEESIKKTSQDIKRIKYEINVKDVEIQLDDLKNKFDEFDEEQINRTLVSRTDLRQIFGNSTLEGRLYANEFNEKKLEAEVTKNYDEFYEFLKNYLKTQNQKVQKEFWDMFNNVGEEQAYSDLADKFELQFSDALSAIRSYGSIVLNTTNEMLKKDEQMMNASFSERLVSAEKYYNETIAQLTENIQKQEELNKKKINEEFLQDEEAERERYTKQYQDLEKQKNVLEDEIANFQARNEKEKEAYERLKDNLETINKQMETALLQHGEKMGQINEEKNNAIAKAESDTYNQLSSIQEKYFNSQITNYRDFQSKLNDEVSRNPVMDRAGFGIVNIQETKRNYKEILNASKTAIDAIRDDKRRLDEIYDKGFITPEAYNATLSQLNDLEKEIKDGINVIKEASKNLVADFIQSIQQYLQAAMESFNTIINAVWDAQDVAFDKEQDQLERLNDELEKKLSEQEALLEQHKSAIDSIEDELANSRGSRRQHLIDQLNAEMAAERAAAKQKQKIQKEQEKAQKRQDALDLKRKKAQYKRDLTQAIVNGAMAVTYAAINAWPIPAVPMMALAAATTAAQIAIMSANKPYAKGGQLEGGVAQGKRHRDGGIPVLGGRASIEGGEFITNRVTTQKNVEVLDFINSKHKKLTLDDFVDFYGGSKVRNNIISSTPKRVFEDGGVIPTLRNDYGIDDRLLTAIEYYNNRPVVVSVVDINKKQADVRRVQTLAGL